MLVQTQKMSATFSIKWTDNTTMEFYNLKNQKAVLLQKFIPPTNHKNYKTIVHFVLKTTTKTRRMMKRILAMMRAITDHNKLLMAAKAMKKIMITTTYNQGDDENNAIIIFLTKYNSKASSYFHPCIKYVMIHTILIVRYCKNTTSQAIGS